MAITTLEISMIVVVIAVVFIALVKLLRHGKESSMKVDTPTTIDRTFVSSDGVKYKIESAIWKDEKKQKAEIVIKNMNNGITYKIEKNNNEIVIPNKLQHLFGDSTQEFYDIAFFSVDTAREVERANKDKETIEGKYEREKGTTKRQMDEVFEAIERLSRASKVVEKEQHR